MFSQERRKIERLYKLQGTRAVAQHGQECGHVWASSIFSLPNLLNSDIKAKIVTLRKHIRAPDFSVKDCF